MSTRSRTRAGVSAKGAAPSTAPAKPKSRVRSQKVNAQQDGAAPMDVDGKENVKERSASVSKAVAGSKKNGTRKKKESLKSVDCTCSKGDDGSPMIYCPECKIWYHFTCVNISEPEAEEINVYICPTCTETTGRRSAMNWEGDQAIEECTDDDVAIAQRRKTALKTRSRTPESKFEVEESEGAPSSEDEYVEDKEEHKGKSRSSEKRLSRLRRLSAGSDSDDSADVTGKRRLSHIKISTSPSPSVHGRGHGQQLKRKATNGAHPSQPPPPKRKRSGDSAADDPARKYCLGKLEELFRDVYLRYPHVRMSGGDVGAGEEGEKTRIMEKKLEELTEEEKEALMQESRQFAHELEHCVFEIYAEPDKTGQPHAGGKYKDRFRMLQFNLSKVDRVIIHQRITSGTISAKEISLMSSTDLADEETKQSIKLAEKEALEHSILEKQVMPRAKITHKGLQDIEEINGEVISAAEQERQKDRELEDEERRERERMARIRPAATERQRTASISVPPESPTVQQSPSVEHGQQQWGGPPPVPLHAVSSSSLSEDMTGVSGLSRPPLFTNLSSDMNVTEPELNLADLINIDEEQETGSTAGDNEMQTTAQPVMGPNYVLSPTEMSFASPVSATPTGISPFAQRQDRSRGASFDLNSLWNASNDLLADSVTPPTSEPTAPAPSTATPTEEPRAEESDKEDAMELESVEANDQDFDMFLDEKEQEAPVVISNIQQTVESLPQVWSGKITMPLDSSVPQETTLIARQVGGKPLASDSPLWRTLFPSDVLRIEGRVPIENSVKYLLQMRMNATKELYAAAFIPASRESEEDFKIFCNFLISKSRHGLVFPWGSRPKEYHPGRELYMVPLLQNEPLPDFIELLDDLKLPKARSRDYLVGIWILNKGKLAPLPGPPQSVPPAQPAQPVQTTPASHTPQPAPMSIPMYNTPPPGPQAPPLGAVSNLPPAIPGLSITPSALAAEVASLTPEQIQSVLRTLTSTTQMALPPLPQPMPPVSQPTPYSQNLPPLPHIPTPPMTQHTPSMPQNAQPWMPAPPPAAYPMNYPPANVPFQQPAPPMHGVNSPHAPPNAQYDRQEYDRQDYDRDFRPGPHYQQGDGHRGEQRWRGHSDSRGGRGARGRGRGRGDHDRDSNARRSSDSGWPRRSRNEGQGGPSW